MFEFRRIRTCNLMEDEQLPAFSYLLCQTSWDLGGGGSYKMMKWDVQQTLMQGIRRCVSSINWPNRGQGPHCHPQWLHTRASSNTNHTYTQQQCLRVPSQKLHHWKTAGRVAAACPPPIRRIWPIFVQQRNVNRKSRDVSPKMIACMLSIAFKWCVGFLIRYRTVTSNRDVQMCGRFVLILEKSSWPELQSIIFFSMAQGRISLYCLVLIMNKQIANSS